MPEAMWQVRNLHFRHRGATVHAVDGVTCDVPAGGITAILGPNGAGKSTLMRLLAGLIRPAAGDALFRGRPAHAWRRAEMARQVGFVPQGEEVVFPMSVREVVAMGRYPHLGPWRAESPADRAAVDEALQAVEASAFRDRPFSTLSGGEQQRVRIARALAQQGAALLLDEPTAGLDIRHEMELFALLGQLARQGHTIVLVTHHLSLAARVADQVLLLEHGRLAGAGAPADILTAAQLTQVYGWPVEVEVEADEAGTLRPLITPQLAAAPGRAPA